MAYPTAIPYKGGAHTLTGPTLLMLGDVGMDGAGSWIVGIRPTGATFAMTPRGRVRGVADTVNTDSALPYADQIASPGTLTSGSTPIAGTASSTNLVIRIPADGLTVALDFSTLSAGTLDVIATPIRGS